MARWACPECGSDDLEVTVEIWAKLNQSGDDPLGEDNAFETDPDEASEHDQEWGENSPMRCRKCDHCKIAAEFMIETDEDLDNRCDKCGKKFEDGGDGFDGMCPECADKAEEEEEPDVKE